MATKTKKTKTQKIIQEKTIELLELLGMGEIKIELKSKEEAIQINIDCDNQGLLIGNYGETLFSLQLILSLIIYHELGSWQRVLVNIGDYLEKRKEALEKIALNTAQKVKFSNKEVAILRLNSSERRIVHMILADNPDVVTESVGEGRERRLIVKPKK